MREAVKNRELTNWSQSEYLNYRDGYIHGIMHTRNFIASLANSYYNNESKNADVITVMNCFAQILDMMLDNQDWVDEMLKLNL